MKRRNPGALATFAWASASAAVGGLAAYFTLREVYAAQVVERCDVIRTSKQQMSIQTGMPTAMLPAVTKSRARAWF
jgi:hypothetical protein